MAKSFEPAPKLPDYPAPAKAAEPKPSAEVKPPEPPRDDRDLTLEALREQVAHLTALINSQAVSAKDVVQAKSREEWFQAQAAEISKGTVVRTQEACDRLFPRGEHRYTCVLTDGNRHPEIVVRADTDVDARARYAAVCGITASEKPIRAVPVA